MANKSTKKALLLSVLSMLLCVAMLVGTTFAWFTDSVTSGKNTIKAGNLDVELEYTATPDVDTSWKTVEGAEDLLDPDALWEPGHAEVVYLRISNLGTLALKYQFSMNIFDEVVGKSVLGNEIHLSDYLEYGVADYTKKFETRDEAIAAVKDSAMPLDNYAVNGTMKAGDPAKVVALVVYMPTTVGNEANYRGETVPSIELGVSLIASQMVYEEDFFGPDYDINATWTGDANTDWYFEDPDADEFVLNSAEDLAGFAAIVNGTATAPVVTFAADSTATVSDTFEGQTVKLGKDIDLNDLAWAPIGRIGKTSTDFTYAFKGIFDGQNHTVSNLNVNNSGWAGLFGVAYKATIQNVTVKGADIRSNRMTGTIVGQIYGNIDNCHAENVYIKVIPNAVGDTFDNGDKVGGIVGWIGDNNNNRVLSNCSVTNVKISGYRDIGGIAGYAAWSTTISNNKVVKTTVTVNQIENFYGEEDPNAGLIWGRNSVSGTGVGITDINNTVDEESITTETYYKDGFYFAESSNSDDLVFDSVSKDYDKDTVNVPEGVTVIGGYAFANNSNVKEIILPSTVTTLNDRAFRDTSASKVVLNEGLTNISYQAFRNALNVTSVEIPSTVTTISKEAFQLSGITSLTVPATVTTIEYGAMRDMKVLETVVIEGNVDIPGYAFRACTELKTVILNGDNVTFGDGMIFTNTETNNENPNNITVYVKNETVKNALEATKNFKGAIVVMSTVEEDANISDSLTDGADTIYVPAGNFTFPSKVSKDDTIICSTDTVFEGTSSLNVNGATVIGGTFKTSGTTVSGTVDGTFKNCVFEGYETLRFCYSTEGETSVFENCVFKTTYRGVHFDELNGNVIFRNCEINGFNAFGGKGTLTFEGCTFGYDGSYYNGLNLYITTNIVDCTFNYLSGKSDFIDMEGTGKTLTITDCVATQDGNVIDITSKIGGSKLAQNTVIVDGVTLTK